MKPASFRVCPKSRTEFVIPVISAEDKRAIAKIGRYSGRVGEERHFQVVYRQIDGGSRRYASMPSLQGMRGALRRALASEIYDDLDIVNAFPTILLQECENQGLSMPRLRDYVDNRSEMMANMIAETGYAGISFKDRRDFDPSPCVSYKCSTIGDCPGAHTSGESLHAQERREAQS